MNSDPTFPLRPVNELPQHCTRCGNWHNGAWPICSACEQRKAPKGLWVPLHQGSIIVEKRV